MSADAADSAPPVFISYGSADREEVLQIADLLESSGIGVWIDRRGIAGGARWAEEIPVAIRQAPVVLVVCSSLSLHSRNVAQELQLAWDRGTPILPLLLEPVTFPDAVEFFLHGSQWIEIGGRPPDEWLPELLRGLRRLGIGPKRTAPSATHTGPPMRAPSIPAPLTPLIGRDHELEAITASLTRHRLVTLTGPGGIGKTRLAIEAARRDMPKFPEGVWFVDLAAVRDPRDALPAVVHALKLSGDGHHSALDLLVDALRDRRALLVLDNLEQLLDAAPEIAALLERCPELVVLATSRAPLAVRGEQVVPVAPLSLDFAVELFHARSNDLTPSSLASSEEAGTIAAICEMLDRLPLAIELAAARTELLTPAALVSRLESQLSVLSGGPRDLPDRQRTMRAAIAWSYDLLEAAEQTLFRQLGVFAGGCTLEAAGDVCDGSDVTVLDGIGTLIGQNLVTRSDAPGEVRIRMLESIREFAVEQLVDSGEQSRLQEAHVAHFLRWAEERRPLIESPAGPETLRRFEAEHPNLRAALALLIGQSRSADATRLVSALWKFWYVHRHTLEGRRWCEQVLGLPGAVPPGLRAEVLYAAGSFALIVGDVEGAVTRAEDCLTIARDIGDRLHTAMAFFLLGNIARHQSRFGEADAMYRDALTEANEPEPLTGFGEHMRGMILASAGDMAYERGDAHRARRLNEQALELWEQRGDPWGMAISLLNLATVTAASGDASLAAARYRQSLSFARDLGDTVIVAYGLTGLGTVAAELGHIEDAARLIGAGDGLRQTANIPVPRMMQADYARAVDAIRRALGPDRFQTAWSEGLGLSAEEGFVLGTTVELHVPPRAEQLPFRLTTRELEVLRLIAQGRTDQEIADELFISYRTATTHVAKILNKLAVDSRTAAGTTAVRLGIVS